MNAQNLEDYKWKNRILVLVDEAADTDAIRSQFQVLKAEEEALLDRDLLIFLVTENYVYRQNGERSNIITENLRQTLNIPINFRGVILIGKDGGVKLKKDFQVDPETIFTLIDGMPMRRAEMRKSKKS